MSWGSFLQLAGLFVENRFPKLSFPFSSGVLPFCCCNGRAVISRDWNVLAAGDAGPRHSGMAHFSQQGCGRGCLHAIEADWGMGKSSDNHRLGSELPANPPWSDCSVSESLEAGAIVWTSPELCRSLGSCFHSDLWHWGRTVYAFWKEKIGSMVTLAQNITSVKLPKTSGAARSAVKHQWVCLSNLPLWGVLCLHWSAVR